MVRPARFGIASVAAFALALVVAACSDRPAPTAPLGRIQAGADAAAACATYTELQGLVDDVFGAGTPDANSALSKLRQTKRFLDRGDTTSARDAARNLIRFVLEKSATLPGRQYVDALIAGVECFVGLREAFFLIYPLDEPQVLLSPSGLAGIKFDADPVDYPTLVTITDLPADTSGILDTKLDQYPGYINITQESADPDGNALKKPAIVAVCASGVPSLEVANRLRLGHQASAGFEITPAVEPSELDFLTCPDPFATASSVSALPAWMESVANLVLPKVAHASVASFFFGGGVGGSVTEFSPFGTVDPVLSFGGGVGGSVTEFIRVPAPTPAAPTTASPSPARKVAGSTKAPGGVTLMAGATANATAVPCGEGYVGQPLAKECRPVVTITTANGTILTGVPVSFEVMAGGGSVAIDNAVGIGSDDCGAFGASAASTTNANGEVGACWTLGAEGLNTLLATATAGGDAPDGVSFTPAQATFNVTAVKTTATLTLSNTQQVYTGSPLAVTVTTSPAGLGTVNVTYNGSATPPTAAGLYVVVATLDNPTFDGSAAGTLEILKAPAPSAFVLSAPAGASYAFGSTVQLSASGGSDEPSAVSFSAGTSTACSVSASGLVQVTSGTGTCAITATKAASANFAAVTSDPFVITPEKAAATLSLTPPANLVYDGTAKAWTVSSAPAGLTDILVSYAPEDPVQAGDYTVTATLSNPDYAAAPVTESFTVLQAEQALLAVTGPTSVAFGGTSIVLGTTGGSGTGTVTFSAGASTACSVTPSGTVTATAGTGSCEITATKAADRNHFATTSAPFPIGVAKAVATLALGGLEQTYDGTPKGVTVTTAPAGLPGVAVTYDGAGDVPVDAGSYAVVATLTSADYAADPVSGTLVIAKATQAALVLAAPTSATAGTTVAVTTSGGSGTGSVSFTTATPAACSVNATTGETSILTGVGTCVVSATRAGDANHLASAAATASIALAKASQAISFGALPARTYGDAPFTVSATAPGGAVSFAAGAGSACTVSGQTVTLTGAGSCAVVATQAGSDFYAAAAPVTQTFTIAKAGATATAGSGNILFGEPVPSLPCSVTGLLPADAGSVTCTTAVPSITRGGTFTTTPTVNPSNPANYLVNRVNGTLNVTYVKQDCFAEPIKPIVPTTTSGITKGATLQVRCTLLDASGRAVTVAAGDLEVRDGGTTGVSNGPVVFSLANAFRLQSGSYGYKLSTSGSGFVKGNFYLVIARWNDGTETRGWFYLNR